MDQTKKDFVVAGTGHRPPRLGLDYGAADRDFLHRFAIQVISRIVLQRPDKQIKILSGAAQGWDQAIATAAAELKIPFLIAVPFEGQESKWPSDAQKDYRELLAKAEKVHVVCQGGYAGWKFIERDKYLVDNSLLLIALHDGQASRSGTGQTIEYAKKVGRGRLDLWPAYEDFRRG